MGIFPWRRWGRFCEGFHAQRRLFLKKTKKEKAGE
jgi:hypothetical protein